MRWRSSAPTQNAVIKNRLMCLCKLVCNFTIFKSLGYYNNLAIFYIISYKFQPNYGQFRKFCQIPRVTVDSIFSTRFQDFVQNKLTCSSGKINKAADVVTLMKPAGQTCTGAPHQLTILSAWPTGSLNQIGQHRGTSRQRQGCLNSTCSKERLNSNGRL